MIYAKKQRCKVTSKEWLTPTVLRIRFKPERPFRFFGGQFISVHIPNSEGDTLKRAYSLTHGKKQGYELCVKFIPGGLGSEYLASLEVKQIFECHAPFGNFHLDYRHEPEEAHLHSICFIGTGSGIGPLRAMAHSKELQLYGPEKTIALLGTRNSQEMLFAGEFEDLGIETFYCLSQDPTYAEKSLRKKTGDLLSHLAHSRVTEVIPHLSNYLEPTETEFYLCGNSQMIEEARTQLRKLGVADTQIHFEAFFGKHEVVNKNPEKKNKKKSKAA